MFRLMSRRLTVARGWVWVKEVDCTNDTAIDWLEIFQKDGPDIKFKLDD